MSVLVFAEESRWVHSGATEYYATVAGAAFEESAYDEFGRRLLRLKERFFKRREPGEYPLRGRDLLNPRVLAGGYRKMEFVQELFSLCRLQGVASFSATRKFPLRPEALLEGLPGGASAGAIGDTDAFTSQSVSLLNAYLIERVNSFMLERHPGERAKLIFKQEEGRRDYTRAAGLMHFFHRTPYGGGFHGLLRVPLFAPAALSPGLQVADVFAYAINQHHGGRREMAEYFREIEAMQFISSIERDEFELRGMNLLE
ncbi:MAG: hypothetical protein C4524_14610 [Candidatus Zixiibacteriota bacterium]|nr:MAG: hypothetical protein C4524_14610 [candidate division Zixibacteria bacterium]